MFLIFGDRVLARPTPWIATFPLPTWLATARKNGGPASVPTLPGSVVPRANRIVMSRQVGPSVSWSFVETPFYCLLEMGPANAKAGNKNIWGADASLSV